MPPSEVGSVSSIAILGGLLVLVQGLMDVAGVELIPAPDLVRPYLLVVGIVSVVSGLIVMYGGWLIAKEKKVLGSRLAVVFAIVGFAGGGGFILGTVLGLAGGLMNWRVID